MTRVLLIGASGLVGHHVLTRLLESARFSAVVAPTRRPLPHHVKLLNPVVDFNALPDDADWWRVDGMISAVGTTMAKAGSRAAFRQVDYALPLACARLAQSQGATAFALNSALGADPGSRIFYNRTKGELERDLIALGFPSLTLVRPGLIGGKRDEYRAGEHAASVVLGLLGPLLPRRWRINPAEKIADALVAAIADPAPGLHLIESAQLA